MSAEAQPIIPPDLRKKPRRPVNSNVCAVHGTNPAGWKSRHQVNVEAKVSRRARASS